MAAADERLGYVVDARAIACLRRHGRETAARVLSHRALRSLRLTRQHGWSVDGRKTRGVHGLLDAYFPAADNQGRHVDRETRAAYLRRLGKWTHAGRIEPAFLRSVLETRVTRGSMAGAAGAPLHCYGDTARAHGTRVDDDLNAISLALQRSPHFGDARAHYDAVGPVGRLDACAVALVMELRRRGLLLVATQFPVVTDIMATAADALAIRADTGDLFVVEVKATRRLSNAQRVAFESSTSMLKEPVRLNASRLTQASVQAFLGCVGLAHMMGARAQPLVLRVGRGTKRQGTVVDAYGFGGQTHAEREVFYAYLHDRLVAAGRHTPSGDGAGAAVARTAAAVASSRARHAEREGLPAALRGGTAASTRRRRPAGCARRGRKRSLFAAGEAGGGGGGDDALLDGPARKRRAPAPRAPQQRRARRTVALSWYRGFAVAQLGIDGAAIDACAWPVYAADPPASGFRNGAAFPAAALRLRGSQDIDASARRRVEYRAQYVVPSARNFCPALFRDALGFKYRPAVEADAGETAVLASAARGRAAPHALFVRRPIRQWDRTGHDERVRAKEDIVLHPTDALKRALRALDTGAACAAVSRASVVFAIAGEARRLDDRATWVVYGTLRVERADGV